MKGVLLILCGVVLNLSLQAQITAVAMDTAQLSSGKLWRISNFPSKYIAPRNVDIWLPEGYTSTKKYAVMYMHDGQMLFDASTTWNHQEWKVDEVASDLMTTHKTRDFIVVGIHSISETRYADLFPQKSITYLTADEKKAFLDYAKTDKPDLVFNGDNYLKYIVKEIKPYIDNHYATLPDRDNTFIAGSSMGGLMSWYAISEYPEVFKGAACMSTHWPGANPELKGPFPEAFFKYLNANMPNPKTHTIYFDFGTETLDQYYPKYKDAVNALFYNKGYTAHNFMNKVFEGADHSEASWQARLHIPFTFLMSE